MAIDAVKDWLDRRKWILLAIAPFVLVWGIQFSTYEALPDQLLGGDMWAQFGIVMHIWTGNAPWTDSTFSGEWAFRDWLLYGVVAGVSRVTFVPPMTVAIFAPVAALAVGGAAMYGIGLRTLRHEGLAVAMAVVWMGFQPYVEFKSSAFAAMAMVPLALYFLVTQDGSARRRVYLGLAYGASSLTYLVAFFGLSLLVLLAFAYDALRPPRVATLWRALRSWLPASFVAVPVVLALWGPILLVYGGRVVNPSHLYADAGHGWRFGRAWHVWRDLFFNYQDPFLFALSVIALVGAYAAWRMFGSHGGRWALAVLVVGVVGAFHYLVTEPLFANNLVYFRWPKVFLRLAGVLLAFQALCALAWSRERQEHSGLVVGAILIVAAVGSAFLVDDSRPLLHDNATVSNARTDVVYSTADWIVENTPRDAVFLAADHESFALNALTGKKVVIDRRTHSNPFVDMDQRFADAAIMMYGTDRAEARRLMDEYDVTHAYIGWYWESNWNDFPLFTNPSHADAWRANGLEFVEEMRPYDPIGEVPSFPVIRLVRPEGAPPFLADFAPMYQGNVDQTPVMTIYERRVT